MSSSFVPTPETICDGDAPGTQTVLGNIDTRPLAFIPFVSYKILMATITQTPHFKAWLSGLTDQVGKAKIIARIGRLEMGNAGDVAPVGDGISEMRIHFGPGYRVYYKKAGESITILCGGDKSTQTRDIKLAKELAT